MTHLRNFLIKREQSQACLSFAKREKSRLLAKLMMTLALLLTAVGGAWADETLLVTIESKDYENFKIGSMTFGDKVTVTFSDEVQNDGNTDGWYSESTPSLLTVAGTNGYTITSCKFYTNSGVAKTGYTVEGESPSVYLNEGYVYTDANKSVKIGSEGVTKIEVYGTASSVEVAWDKTAKTGSFTMPGGNVTLEPEYYPQAALAAAPTAINDVPATTDGAIVKAGTVANIGETTTAQGTLMYYVSQTALDDAALLALAADAWKADVPTAAHLTAGEAYVYYYVRGNDSDNDAETFSDGDILAANALTVTIAAEPTYAVTFAEGTDLNEWTATPNTEVKKETKVDIKYTGTKKVIGVKAEKKAKAAPKPIADVNTNDVGKLIGLDGYIYVTKSAATTAGTTAVAVIAYVGSETYDDTYKKGLAIALTDESGTMNWSTAKTTCEGKTAVTNAKWCLPSAYQWRQMCKANGGNDDNCNGLYTTITTHEGTAWQSVKYWTSTEPVPGYESYFRPTVDGSGGLEIMMDDPNNSYYARACLVF